ncbi:hypothetical protein Tco_1104931 [Tanacetum coccineum]
MGWQYNSIIIIVEAIIRKLCPYQHYLSHNLEDDATYSASADDIVVQSCFFNTQLTNLSPKNYIPPEVLLPVSIHPAWSASEQSVSLKPEIISDTGVHVYVGERGQSRHNLTPRRCYKMNPHPSMEVWRRDYKHTINGKNAYELKGKFLDDLYNNAFSGTNGEDAVEHIEYFLKIVGPIDLPNVNQDKLRVVVFPISLVGDAWSNEIEPTNDEISDLEETDHNDEQEIGEISRIETNLFDYETPLCEKFKEFNYLLKIDPNVLTKDIEGLTTYDEYKDDWIYEWNENVPWVHKKLWTDTGREDGYCNGGNLPGAYIVGNTLHYQDLECHNGWRRWDGYKIADHDQEEKEYENEHEDEERCELFDDYELPVCTIRRFEMIKYLCGHDEEYVAIKEDEYEGLMNTSKGAIHAYQ